MSDTNELRLTLYEYEYSNLIRQIEGINSTCDAQLTSRINEINNYYGRQILERMESDASLGAEQRQIVLDAITEDRNTRIKEAAMSVNSYRQSLIVGSIHREYLNRISREIQLEQRQYQMYYSQYYSQYYAYHGPNNYYDQTVADAINLQQEHNYSQRYPDYSFQHDRWSVESNYQPQSYRSSPMVNQTQIDDTISSSLESGSTAAIDNAPDKNNNNNERKNNSVDGTDGETGNLQEGNSRSEEMEQDRREILIAEYSRNRSCRYVRISRNFAAALARLCNMNLQNIFIGIPNQLNDNYNEFTIIIPSTMSSTVQETYADRIPRLLSDMTDQEE